MEKEPWDQPCTPEGREELIRLGEQYEAAGMVREFGLTALRLSQVAKQIGSGREGVNAFSWSSNLGQSAVDALRQTENRASLADALRAAAPPFGGPDKEILLKESLEISTEIGDLSRQGWAHYALASPPTEPDEHLSLAKACFEAAGNKRGMAVVKQREGVQSNNGNLILEAVDLYLESDSTGEAYRALVMASLFGRKHFSFDEREVILLRSLEIARTRGEVKYQYSSLKQLADLMKDAKRKEDRKRYLDELKELDYAPPTLDD